MCVRACVHACVCMCMRVWCILVHVLVNKATVTNYVNEWLPGVSLASVIRSGC